MDQSKLTPHQQDAIFAILKAAGQLSPDKGQSQDTPDPGAQVDASPSAAQPDGVDYDRIQNMFHNATSGLQMQDGDKLHPMDAISQIGSQMYQSPAGPAKPAGMENATGPKLSANSDGQLTVPVKRNGLLGLFGLKKNEPINTPNYFHSAQEAGIEKYLPTGLAQLPDGTPFVGQSAYEQAKQTAAYGLKANKAGAEVMTTPDQITARGVPADDAALLLKAYPNGVSEKTLQDWTTMQGLGQKNRMTDAMIDRAGAMKLTAAAKVAGIDGLNSVATAATKNLSLITRASQLIKQIEDSGGVAIQAQRAELASVLGAVAGQNNGVLTDEKLNQFLPQSAKAKFGNLVAYWTNENKPIDFTGFLPQMKDLLGREQEANKVISNAGTAPGLALLATQYPELADVIQKQRAVNPLVGNPPPPAPGSSAPSAPQMTPPPAARPSISANDIAALGWLKDNPLSPKAAKIKAALKAKGIIQ